MKKVLIAFEEGSFSDGAFEFARRLNMLEPIMLTGLFVPMFVNAGFEEKYGCVDKFEQHCISNGIKYVVHSDLEGFSMPEIREETRFADVLVVGSENFYKDYEAMQPDDFLKTLLHESECPVIVVPDKFIFPERNILAYDGSAASVYALKQFAYLFPKLAKQETVVVHMQPGKWDFPEEGFVKELVSGLYPACKLLPLQIEPRHYFSSWAVSQKGVVVVTGAFGRGVVSEAFRKSFAAELLKDQWVPVFIAHPWTA